MAYIYRYKLRNKEDREYTNLKAYEDKITNVVTDRFEGILKDVHVEEQYFEFKLFETVPAGDLQEMGRRLRDSIRRVYGFTRMQQTFYALVFPGNDSDETEEMQDRKAKIKKRHIELIDSMLIDDPEGFNRRAREYVLRQRNYQGKNRIDEAYLFEDKGFINNYYIDVQDAEINQILLKRVIAKRGEVTCLSVKGIHIYISKNDYYSYKEDLNSDESYTLLERCYDADYLIKHQSSTEYSLDHVDYLKIYTVKEKKEKIKEIEDQLPLLLDMTSEIEPLNGITADHVLELRVHNVGQALATSLSQKGGQPFLYFDYGLPFGENSGTRPETVDMRAGSGTAIIISHTDKDHWLGISQNPDAVLCDWYLPDQLIKNQLRHKLAEILFYGGSVHLIRNSIIFNNGILSCSGSSRRRPSRAAEHVHETGLCFRLNATSTDRKDLNILIPGDQRYDYIKSSMLNNLDILVASHHGGDFSWDDDDDDVPTAKTKQSKIVYSCGLDNTYCHPSRVLDYTTANWNDEHRTYADGDFCMEFYLNGG